MNILRHHARCVLTSLYLNQVVLFCEVVFLFQPFKNLSSKITFSYERASQTAVKLFWWSWRFLAAFAANRTKSLVKIFGKEKKCPPIKILIQYTPRNMSCTGSKVQCGLSFCVCVCVLNI